MVEQEKIMRRSETDRETDEGGRDIVYMYMMHGLDQESLSMVRTLSSTR